MVEVVLCLFDEGVYLLQPLQIPYCRRKEESENHVDIVGESLAALLLVRHKVDHHVCLEIAYGDGHVALVYYTKRHGGVWRTRAYLLDIRYTKDNEHPSVVILVACTFVGIADVGQEIVGYVEFVFQKLLVVVCRTRYLYPAVGLPFADGLKCRVCIPKCSHKDRSPWVKTMCGRPAVMSCCPPALQIHIFRVIVVHILRIY